MKHVLDLPWSAADDLKEKYALKAIKGGYMLYTGVLLPRELRPFKSEDFSYTRWVEDEANAHVSTPEKGLSKIILSSNEENIADKIVKQYTVGKSGIVLKGSFGSSIENISIMSASMISHERGIQPWDDGVNKSKLLVVTEKSLIPLWRMKLRNLPVATAMTRPLIISHEHLNKLLMAPPSARISQKQSVKTRLTVNNGVPTIDWDVIIFDNISGYPRSKAAINVAKLNKQYVKDRSPFVIFMLTEALKSPFDNILASKVLSDGIKSGAIVSPNEWGRFLKDEKFGVINDPKSNYIWLGLPPKRGFGSKEVSRDEAKLIHDHDLSRLKNAYKSLDTVFEINDPVYDNKYVPIPIELNGAHKNAYSEIWDNEFKPWLNRYLMNTDVEGYQHQSNRYRWRVNMLKETYVLSFIQNLLNISDKSIYLKVATPEAATAYLELCKKKKIKAGIVINNESSSFDDFINRNHRVAIVASLPETAEVFNDEPYVILVDSLLIKSFEQDQEQVFPGTDLTVFVPFVERTLEEKVIEIYLSDVENKLNKLERLYRLTAAKSTPPNRMS